jgi:DNA-binding NarL/FixJ family response regulator
VRMSIIVTDDDGNTFEGEAELSASSASKSVLAKKKSAPRKASNVAATVNLSSPIRQFVKKHAQGMGGAQKFTLLLAHIAKGDTNKEIAMALFKSNGAR